MQKEIDWILKEKYNGQKNKNFKKDLKRLKKGEPIDYIIGFKEFLGCKIDLSKKPLIPRPETEYWTAQAIDEIKNSPVINTGQNLRILDIFSGSGCVGVAVLANVNNLLCDFADIDKNNIKQIKINLKNNFIDFKRYKIIKSDIFKNINKKNKYNFIFANPPYIPTKNKNKIQKSVLKYEPKKALFGGNDGLKYIDKFLKQAKNYLDKNGKIFFEFDSPQKMKIEKLLKKYKYQKWEFNKDQYGKWRWVMLKYI